MAGVLLGLTAEFLLLYRWIEASCHRSACPELKGKKWAILPLVLLYFFGNYLTSIFPSDRVFHLYRENGPLQAFKELRQNLPQNARTLKLETPASQLSGSIVLVLGESACRDDMSAFADTPENTTPWEKSHRQDQCFFFYPHAYSNFPNTVMAITQALTSANQYNRKPLKYSVDIMTLAKKAGYETYWISTQEQSSVSDAGKLPSLPSRLTTRNGCRSRMKIFWNRFPGFLRGKRILSSCTLWAAISAMTTEFPRPM